jgi:hypothetical protein
MPYQKINLPPVSVYASLSKIDEFHQVGLQASELISLLDQKPSE